ncbi:MAG TPA: glycosyltransferase family 4 protein [Candidatus Saccharimonadales bacterium]|nr:glycosyltransferase family 4 protein [Candidatus Saccharimonadales bacterium]
MPAKPIPLKIALVLDDSLDRPDGVQQYVVTLGEWLRTRGHDVHYLTSTTTRQDIPNIHSLGRNMGVRFNGNRLRMPLPANQRSITALLQEEQFNVLHVQMPYSPFLAGRIIAAAAPDTAVVGTFHILPHGWAADLLSHVLAAWCWPTLRRYDRVMSVSDGAQAFARRAFGVRSDVVPNAVQVERFRHARPHRLHGKEALHILFLGRLVPRKGCLTLLEAIAMLNKQDASLPAYSVTICGSGPLEYNLKRYVREQGLADLVTFTGFVPEIEKPRYYAGADIAVFPSMAGESFGIVLVEAMANGHTAVLAGDNPGYRFVLRDSPGEVLFDPFDPAHLASRLRMLLHDTALRRHIATWQGRHAEEFAVGRVGAQVEETYQAALRHRRSMR